MPIAESRQTASASPSSRRSGGRVPPRPSAQRVGNAAASGPGTQGCREGVRGRRGCGGGGHDGDRQLCASFQGGGRRGGLCLPRVPGYAGHERRRPARGERAWRKVAAGRCARMAARRRLAPLPRLPRSAGNWVLAEVETPQGTMSRIIQLLIAVNLQVRLSCFASSCSPAGMSRA